MIAKNKIELFFWVRIIQKNKFSKKMTSKIPFQHDNYFGNNICDSREWQNIFEENFKKKYQQLKLKRAESKEKREKENKMFIDLEANIQEETNEGATNSSPSRRYFTLDTVSNIWHWCGSKFYTK